MEAKEKQYRIGNLIKYDGRVFEIDSIAKEFPTLNTEEFGIGVVDWNNIKPIPLTKQLLLKCGFKHVHTGWFEINSFGSEFMHFNVCASGAVSVDNGGDSEIVIADLKFIHQLQNLYFAITGKELELKTELKNS